MEQVFPKAIVQRCIVHMVRSAPNMFPTNI
ncbi:MAG: hypothetical protein IPN87_11855 [Saprospiraceae bacterium]|nr:hypothetical protein [Candidatus Brachybacter algidus]